MELLSIWGGCQPDRVRVQTVAPAFGLMFQASRLLSSSRTLYGPNYAWLYEQPYILFSMFHSMVLISSDYFLCLDAGPNSQKLTLRQNILHPKFQLSSNVLSHENSLGVPELSISIHNPVIVLYCSDDLISSSCIPILIRVLRNISRLHESKDYNLPLADFHM